MRTNKEVIEAWSKIRAKLTKEDNPSIDVIGNYLNEMIAINTPPTVNEVCEELSRYYKGSVYFDGGKFYVHSDIHMTHVDLNKLSPRLLILVGRFYKGEKENDNNNRY